MPVDPIPKRLRQENFRCGDSLGYIASLSPKPINQSVSQSREGEEKEGGKRLTTKELCAPFTVTVGVAWLYLPEH